LPLTGTTVVDNEQASSTETKSVASEQPKVNSEQS
jgi:hypothetical protein